MRLSSELTVVMAAAVLTAGGFVAASEFLFAGSARGEERALYPEFRIFMTPAARADYDKLPLFTRLDVARSAARTIQRLEDMDLPAHITDVIAGNGPEPPALFYQLEVGDSELVDCTIAGVSAQPAGFCQAVEHPTPGAIKGEGRGRQRQDVRLALFLDSEQPYAASVGRSRVKISEGGGLEAEGVLVLDRGDVRLKEAVLLVPDPWIPGGARERLEVPDFSLREAAVVTSSRAWRWRKSLPAGLGALLGGGDLTLIEVNGLVTVDRRSEQPGYRVEGGLVLLGQPVAHASVEVYPDQYFSVYVDRLAVSILFPNLCFEIRGVLAELDLNEYRLRLMGRAEVGTARALGCSLGPVPSLWGWVGDEVVETILENARSQLGLWDSLAVAGHVVIDLDEQTLCANLSLNETSIVQMAYFGIPARLEMGAPLALQVQPMALNHSVRSAVGLAKAFRRASWSFPVRDPLRCWDGDEGPRSGVARRMLTSYGSDWAGH